jgi:glucosamine-6-phosphate deaminase
MNATGSFNSGPQPGRVAQYDRLAVEIYPTRLAAGQAAARAVAQSMRMHLTSHNRVAMVFAAAPSQNEFLAALAEEPDLDWKRVIAFHLDEYLGLPSDAAQNFGSFLRSRLFDLVKPGVVHYLDGNVPDSDAEARRYSKLLAANPLDIACLGIGENGHLAFNDPAVADFVDPERVKIVEIDEVSRLQQVHDGCFARLEDVPTRALTVTIPPLVGATVVSCVVPGPSKGIAVRDALCGPIATSCPASILRRHEHATLYLDPDSAQLMQH